MMGWPWKGDTLTYRQVIDAVKEAIQPLQKDIIDLRDKVNLLQMNAVQQATLDKYCLKETQEAQARGFDDRVAKLESAALRLQNADNDETREKMSEKSQSFGLAVNVTTAIIIALSSGFLTLIISHILK
jgi:hypothetical protein